MKTMKIILIKLLQFKKKEPRSKHAKFGFSQVYGLCFLTLAIRPQRYVFPIIKKMKITLHWCLMTLRYNSPLAETFGLILDSKLDFNEYIDNKINKCNKIIGITKRLSLHRSRKHLLTICKSFVRSKGDSAEIIYDKPFNESFKKKIEIIQYKAALVITGVLKGKFRERIYHELQQESLTGTTWSHRLFFFHKVTQGLLPSYLQTCHNAASEGAYLTHCKK